MVNCVILILSVFHVTGLLEINLIFFIQKQWGKNGGKCGVCGDDWEDPQPRANEVGPL